MVATPVHARLRIGGQLYNDAHWSIGVAVVRKDGGDPFDNITLDVQGSLERFADNVRAMNSNQIFSPAMASLLSNGGTIEYVRTSRVGELGRETDVALVTGGPLAAGLGNPNGAAQSAAVVSLLTGRPGASYRGRLYLPALNYSLTSGRLPAALCQTLATESADWIDDIGNASENFGGTVDCKAAVVSTVRGARTAITQTRVGNRLDTQRRRAEGEKEVYSVATVAQ